MDLALTELANNVKRQKNPRAFIVQAETIRRANLHWRIIIFLPFNVYWRLVQSLLILISVYIDLYNLLVIERIDNLLFFYVLAYCFFAIDCILETVHKLWGRVARAYHYPTKHWFNICLDWVTIFPIRLVYNLIYDTNRVSTSLAVPILFLHLIREFRVHVYLQELTYFIGRNQKLIAVFGFNLKFLFILNILTVIWILVKRFFGAPTAATPWEQFLIKYHEAEYTNLVRYFASLAINFQHLSRGMCTVLTETPFFEKVFNLCVITVGVMYQEIIFPSQLISVHAKSDKHKFQYKSYLKLVERKLEILGAESNLKDKVMRYYLDFWTTCNGLKDAELLSSLPVCMQKDICSDLNWDPIQHSHVYRYNGINLKRELSLRIKNEFLQPGDYIFRHGTIKAKVVYIVSGVVQIMSELDGVSPLISFSSGTLLGGVSTVLPTLSSTDIRCATYCEVRTLGMHDLFAAIQNYPWETGQLTRRVFRRIREAQMMVAVNEEIERRGAEDYRYHFSRDNRIKWIKKRWRTIASFKKKLEKGEDVVKLVENVPVDAAHTSKYLDMVVLSEDIELKKDRFCLRCKWPFVIDPASSFLSVWLILVTALIFVESLFLPYFVAFHRKLSDMFRRFLIFMSYVYAVDLYIQFVTAVKEHDVIIIEPMAIVRHKLKSFRYILECFSTLPIGLSLWLGGFDDNFSTLMELLRLLKSWRVVYFIILLENDIAKPTHKIRFFRHVISILGLTYFSACFLYLKTCYSEVCDRNGWYEMAKIQLAKHLQMEEIVSFVSSFTFSLYYAFSVSLRAPLTMTKIWTVTDVVSVFILGIIFLNGYEYSFAELTATMLLKKKLEQEFQQLLERTEKFMSTYAISTETRNCFDSYLRLQWKYNSACDILLNKPVFFDASQDLKNEIMGNVARILKTIPLFSGETKEMNDFVKKNSENAKLYILPRNMSIVKAGVKATSLNILRKGYCRMISYAKEDLASFPEGVLIGPGSYFPVPELVYNLPSIVTVDTVSECEVITVEADDLVKSILVNRPVKRDILSTVNSYPRVREMYASAATELEEPTYQEDSSTSPKVRAQSSGRIKYGLRTFIRLPYVIAPDGQFIYYWELARTVLTIISCNYFILFYTLMKPVIPEYCYIIGGILDILSLLDVYVRLHVSYYNDDGILVTNPKSIIKHYIKHSFTIDLLSCLPLYALIKFSGESDRTWFILTVFKMLPYYRVTNFFRYLKEIPKVKKYIPHFLSYIIGLLTVMNITANVIAQYLCCFRYKVDENNWQVFDEVQCSAPIMREIQLDKTPFNVIVVSFFIAMTIYTATRCTPIRAMNSFEMYIVILGVILGTISRTWFSVSSIILIMGGEKDFSEHTDHVSSFIKFAKNSGVNKRLKDAVLVLNQYSWSQMQGEAFHQVLQKVHPSVRMEAFKEMYSAKLRLVKALSAGDESFFRTLAMKVTEHFATKGSVICDKHNLNDNIYFIGRGEIDVIVSEALRPIGLCVGAMFGCFKKKGKHRHTLRFEARVHTHLLVIKAETFYELLQNYKNVKKEFIRSIQPHKEYIEGKFSPSREAYIPKHSKPSSRFHINTRTRTYRFADYIMSYIVPYLTFIFLFSYLAQPRLTFCPYVLYILDGVYCIRIITVLTVPYTEKETGLLVTDKKLIRRRYLRDPRFYCDILSLMPINMIQYLAGDMRHWPLYYFNRLFRLLTFARYIQYRGTKLYVIVFSKKADLLLLIPLFVYVLSCLWTRLFHIDRYSYYSRDGTLELTVTGWRTIWSSMNFIISLISRSSREYIEAATDPLPYIFISALLLLENLLFLTTLGWIANMYYKSNVIMAIYENKAMKLKTHLRQCDISPPLMESAWQYVRLLWQKERGRNLPRLLEDSPYTIKTNIMHDIYGHHLEKNTLFHNLHPAFLRQLSARLKRTLYFPDNYIVFQGDVDQKMYFIHSGEVEIIIQDKREHNIGVLAMGDDFGLVQGLYNTQPHVYTYKARTEADILSLERENWTDLRAAFPHDTKLIYTRATNLSFVSN